MVDSISMKFRVYVDGLLLIIFKDIMYVFIFEIIEMLLLSLSVTELLASVIIFGVWLASVFCDGIVFLFNFIWVFEFVCMFDFVGVGYIVVSVILCG